VVPCTLDHVDWAVLSVNDIPDNQYGQLHYEFPQLFVRFRQLLDFFQASIHFGPDFRSVQSRPSSELKPVVV